MSEHGRVPDLYAECDALGELPVDLDPARREILDEEPERSRRRKCIEESDREILAQLPAEEMASRIRARWGQASDRQPAWPIVALAAASAATVLVLVFLVFSSGGRPSDEVEEPQEIILHKGDPRLVVHRRVGEGSVPLGTGDRARPGDRLQLSYMPYDAAHGVIVSVDGRGEVTLHFPEDREQPTTLERGNSIPLGFSYELDDAPGFERFIFVTSPLPIPIAEVLQAAEKLGADPESRLELPGGWKQKSFLLNKP